jgi:hypothetical protein
MDRKLDYNEVQELLITLNYDLKEGYLKTLFD